MSLVMMAPLALIAIVAWSFSRLSARIIENQRRLEARLAEMERLTVERVPRALPERIETPYQGKPAALPTARVVKRGKPS